MKKKDIKELRRIMESVPEEMKNRLIVKRYASPTLRKIADKVLKDEDTDPEYKEKLQTIKDSGMLDKKEDQVNKTAQKEIDKYINEEIAKSIMAGRLSKPKDSTLAAKYVKKCRKNLKKNLQSN